MWDVYLAYAVLWLVVIVIITRGPSELQTKSGIWQVAVAAFIGLEADILFRIFVLIPGQTYRLFYDLSAEHLIPIWAAGAAVTPIKVALAVIFTVAVAPSILSALKKTSFTIEEVDNRISE